MQPITPLMRDALAKAHAEDGLRRVHNPDEPGAAPWPGGSSAASLAALVKRGYLDRSEVISRNGNRIDLWRATDAGRDALEDPEWLPHGYERLPDGRVMDFPINQERYVRDPGADDRKPAPEAERVERDEYLMRAQRMSLHQWQRDRAEYTARLESLPLADRVANARRLVAEDRSGVLRREWGVLERLVADGKGEDAIGRRLTAIEDAALPRAA